MLIIRTKLSFIKKHKKTKTGKKVYKKKYFRALYTNDIKIGMITSVSISRGTNDNIKKPVFDENSFGWNQELQDFFKEYPPIPIENIEISIPTEQLQSYGIKIFKGDEHETLISTTRRIANMSPEERIEEAKKWEADNFYPHKVQALYQGSKDILNDDDLPEGFNLTFVENDVKPLRNFINGYADLYNRKDIVLTLDLDDVIYDLMKRNISFIEETYGVKDVQLEITDYYYLYRTYPRIAEELWNHPENYISAELVDGAIEFYNELVELLGGEHRLQIVTSSMENVIPLKDKMIKEKFKMNCKVTHSIFGKYKKHHFTKDTFLIEDHVGNLKDHRDYNNNTGVIFNHMKLPYIEELSKQENFEHTTTYKEVIESVKRYLEKINFKK